MDDSYYDIWNLEDDYNPWREQAPPPQNAPDLGSFGVTDNGNNRPGYMDLSYYQTRHDQGLPGAPGLDDMFNLETGQLNDGFVRTGNGYERRPTNAAPPAPGPYGNNPQGPNYGPTNNQWGYLTEPFMGRPPAWRSAPTLNLPTFTPPPAFAYKQFQAPTKDSLYTDPSYQFREEQGRKSLEQSAAGRGTLRTGGTLKNLVDYGQNAASQEYSNVFGRAVDAHNLGLQQELGTYGTNYGVSRDTYDRLFEESRAEYEPIFSDNNAWNQREFDNFLAEFDIFERNRKRASDELWRGAGSGS